MNTLFKKIAVEGLNSRLILDTWTDWCNSGDVGVI